MTTPADPAAPVPPSKRPPSAADFSMPLAADPTAPVPEPTVLDAAPAAEQNVNRAAGSNAVWTMGGFIAMQVIRFGSNLILTRLLFPEVFGAMTLLNTVLQGIQMFTDIGIGPSLVQNKRGEDAEFLNTAWTIMVVRGVFLWVVASLAAFPLHLIYSDYNPPLWQVLPAVAATAAIAGFESTSIYTLQRRLLRARKVMLEVATYLVTMTLTITGCWVLREYIPLPPRPDKDTPGFLEWLTLPEAVTFLRYAVWILVVSNVFSTILNVAVSHFLIPGYRNRYHFDRKAFHELFHFGKWVFISTFFTFVAMQSDKFIVGVDQGVLGVYSVAISLAMIPGQLLNTVGWQLVFPMYTRLHQAGQEVRSTFQRLHPLAGGFAAFLTAGLIGAGPSLVCFLYDNRYHDAGWMLPIMALGVWFQSLEVLECSILWTQGDTKSPTLSNISKVMALLVFAPLGYFLGDRMGMALLGLLSAFVASDFVRYLFTMLAARKRGLTIIPYDLTMTGMLALSAGIAWGLGQLWTVPEELGRFDLLMLGRALTEGGFIVLFWAIPAVYCWKKGLFRVARQEPNHARSAAQ